MSLIFANDDEEKKGWKLSIQFLKEIRQKVAEIELGDDTPSLEQIEDVIVAYEECKKLEGPKNILANQEPYYYEVGAPVLIYWEDTWQNGQIINGYRTRDGLIHVQTDNGQMVSFGEARHEEFIKPV